MRSLEDVGKATAAVLIKISAESLASPSPSQAGIQLEVH